MSAQVRQSQGVLMLTSGAMHVAEHVDNAAMLLGCVGWSSQAQLDAALMVRHEAAC